MIIIELLKHKDFALKIGNMIDVHSEKIPLKNFCKRYKGMYLKKCVRTFSPLIKIQDIKDLEQMEERMFYSISTKQRYVKTQEEEKTLFLYNSKTKIISEDLLKIYDCIEYLKF